MPDTSLHFLCRRDEVQPGQMRRFQVGPIRIALCRSGATFSALRDVCPHQGASLSAGVLGGTNVQSQVGEYRFDRAGEIVRCPRHGFEYDVGTGRALHDPERMRVRVYRVVERGDDVFVEVSSGPAAGGRDAS